MGLADYLTDLRAKMPQDLVVVPDEVDVQYGTTAVCWDLRQRRRNCAVLFPRLRGFPWPLVANVLGTRERMALALGTTADDLLACWTRRTERLVPPLIVPSGPVHEVTDEGDAADVTTLPIPTHFVQDAGPYISSAIVVARDPETGVGNLSYHRCLVKGPRRLGTSLHSRGHLWEYARRAEERGEPLPVALIIGAHPAVYIGAAARVAFDIDEYDVIGALLERPLDVVRCRTVDLLVPAAAEIVIEGVIPPGLREDEGPFGEYTGYATGRSTRHVIEVRALTRRAAPMYMDVLPGDAPEHLLLSKVPRLAHVARRAREVLPTLRDIHFPSSGTHYHCYASITQTAPGQAKQAILTLLGLDTYLKLVIVVDDDVDVHSEEDVLWAVATRMQADRDVVIVPEVFGSRLDPSSADGLTAKMGIDATRPPEWRFERLTFPADAAAEARALVERALASRGERTSGAGTG